jgi:hypothetical protein
MKKRLTIALLSVGFLAWRMGAMQEQNQKMVTLIPSDGVGIRVPIDEALLFETINVACDYAKDEDGKITKIIEPIELKNISAVVLNHLIYELPQILAAQTGNNNGLAPNAEVRKERAQHAARAMAQTAYNQTLLKLTNDRFQAAVYLDIPELYERYARMIADMLISDAGLAALSRNAAILNKFTVASEVIVANYIPELWFEVCTLKGHTEPVMSASFSPDGSLVVTASEDRSAKIWNAATGAKVRDLMGHADIVDSAAFSPDGTRVATASYDRTAKIWNAATGALVWDLVGHTSYLMSAVFSPDGTRVVTASWDHTAKIWNAATGARVWDLVGHTKPVRSASFSPDGKRVVTASDDNTAKVWNAVTGVLIRDLEGHTDLLYSAEFSPQGTKVVTASEDKTAKIWQLLPRSLPGVNDVDAALFIHLLSLAHTHNQRITDTAWAPKVLHAIKWNEINPADKKLLQGWIGAAGIR